MTVGPALEAYGWIKKSAAGSSVIVPIARRTS